MFVLLLCIYIAARQSCKTIPIVLPDTSSSTLSIYTHDPIHIYMHSYWVFKFIPKTCWDSCFSSIKACSVTLNRSILSRISADFFFGPSCSEFKLIGIVLCWFLTVFCCLWGTFALDYFDFRVLHLNLGLFNLRARLALLDYLS